MNPTPRFVRSPRYRTHFSQQNQAIFNTLRQHWLIPLKSFGRYDLTISIGVPDSVSYTAACRLKPCGRPKINRENSFRITLPGIISRVKTEGLNQETIWNKKRPYGISHMAVFVIRNWRRGRDSNSRYLRTHAFQACTLSRSATSPDSGNSATIREPVCKL